MIKSNQENRINLSKTIPLSEPLVIHLETTNKCNFRCKFCPESDTNYAKLSGGYKVMKLDQFKKIVNNIKKSFKKISRLRLWIMGEPLINPDIFLMIEYAKNQNIADSIELTSNASLINSERALSLVNSGLDLCKISIYGFNNEDFKSTTNSNIKFNKILDNVKLLFELRNNNSSSKLKIMAKTVGDTSNKILKNYMNKLSKFVDYIEINEIHSWTEGNEKNIEKKSTKQKNVKEVCPFPFYTLAIHSDGDVSPCCVDWKKDVFLGNCLDKSLKEIWDSKILYSLRMAQLNRDLEKQEGCKNCNYFIDNTSDNLDSLKADDFVKRF
tara:strand:- start:143 stop:1120 length:978 start_codon:yes stop_codon:yes gene_type:complete